MHQVYAAKRWPQGASKAKTTDFGSGFILDFHSLASESSQNHTAFNVRAPDANNWLRHQSAKFGNAPNVVGNASGHRRRNPKRLMHSAIVVMHEVDRNSGNVVFDLLREPIREP